MKRIIFDLDNTISFTDGGDYRNAKPNVELILKMKEYKKMVLKLSYPQAGICEHIMVM